MKLSMIAGLFLTTIAVSNYAMEGSTKPLILTMPHADQLEMQLAKKWCKGFVLNTDLALNLADRTLTILEIERVIDAELRRYTRVTGLCYLTLFKCDKSSLLEAVVEDIPGGKIALNLSKVDILLENNGVSK